MILYYLLILLSIIIAILAYKKNRKVLVYALILILSVMSGLRDVTVGTDTERYFAIIDNIIDGNESSFDIGFVYMCSLIGSIFGSTRAVILFYSFLINTLVISRLWTMRKFASFGFAVFLYLAIFFPQSMNILRQYLALAIVFWGTIFLENRKYFCFLLSTLLATTFHISGIMGCLIMFVWLIIVDSGNIKKYKKFFVCIAIILFVIFAVYAYNFLFFKYAHYLMITKIELNLVFVGRSILVLSFLLIGYYQKRLIKIKDMQENYFLYILYIYLLGIVVSVIGCFYQFAGRISLFFLIFEIPFASIVASNNKRLIWTISYAIFAFYYLVVKTGMLGESNIIPYKLCF